MTPNLLRLDVVCPFDPLTPDTTTGPDGTIRLGYPSKISFCVGLYKFFREELDNSDFFGGVADLGFTEVFDLIDSEVYGDKRRFRDD